MTLAVATGSEELVQEGPRVACVDPLVAACRVALQRVHERRVAGREAVDEYRPAGIAEAGPAAGLRILAAVLERDDLVLHVLEVRRGRAPLRDDDLRLLRP